MDVIVKNVLFLRKYKLAYEANVSVAKQKSFGLCFVMSKNHL